MEFTQIKYFYEAAVTENLSRAAERLNISQPSLTKSVKRLEYELGTELFDRIGHKIVLNDNGRLFLNEITPLLAKLDDIYDRMAVSSKKRSRRVTIGIWGVSSLADEAIISFKNKYPDTDVDIKCHIEREEHIEITDYDMLLYSSADGRFKKYKGYRLSNDPLMIAVYKGHPLFGQKYYDMSELSGEKFIVVRHKGIHSEAHGILMRQRLSINEYISTDDAVKQMAFVRSGAGISAVFKSECMFINEKDIHFLEPAESSLSRNMMICFKRDHLLSECGRLLKNSVREDIFGIN